MKDQDTRRAELERRLAELKKELTLNFGEPSFEALDAEFRDAEEELRSLRERSSETEFSHPEPVEPHTEADIPENREVKGGPLWELFGFRRKV